MSTELHIRLWLEPAPAGEQLQRIASMLKSSPMVDGGWQELRRGAPGRAQALAAQAVFPLTIPQIAQPDFLSTGIAARAWRFEEKEAVEGFVRIGVDVWDQGHPQRPDRALDGDACLWFQQAGPFVAALRSGYEQADERVEENLEALNALLLHCIDKLDPSKMAIYTDAGFHHPFNAHAIYHRARAGFADDLALMRRLWREGSPGWRLPPLSQAVTPRDGDSLHGWRSAAERERLWQAMAAAMAGTAGGPEAVAERLEALMESQRFDFYARGGGLMLLEYPHMLNAFMDRFYLELAGGPEQA